MLTALSEVVVETIKSAARKLTGFSRRQFQAEVAEQHCGGSPRQAERMFGWGREAVNTGLNERRTGIRCWDDFSSRGRHKTEEQWPELAQEIHALVEPHSQADPKFQTPLAFTRLTAQTVHQQLVANTVGDMRPVPTERTIHNILNRLGYRLRRVRKTKPQKNFLKLTLSSTICGKSTRKPRATRKPSAFRSTPKPR
jgi:hypothetical protein